MTVTQMKVFESLVRNRYAKQMQEDTGISYRSVLSSLEFLESKDLIVRVSKDNELKKEYVLTEKGSCMYAHVRICLEVFGNARKS